jgi:hypothetical protein
MGLFGKKNTKSTLRFCQSAVELDTSHLFSDWDLTLALSQLSEWHHDALKATEEANAYGVVHDTYGHGQPLLPVEVKFSFSPPYTEGEAGHGSIWKTDLSGAEYYKAEVVIHDPDRAIYEGFRRLFEHSAISGNSYAHLILRREKKPYVSDNTEREAARKAESERIKALMVQVEAGEADMPNLEFNRVAFDDIIALKAPAWSRDWHDDLLNRVKYHSKEAATWRNMPWRR